MARVGEVLGVRRLKMARAIWAATELDQQDWFGEVVFHLGAKDEVKVAVRPAPRSVRLPDGVSELD